MRAASQLPGKGPTDVDDAAAPAHLSKNQIMMIYVVVTCCTRSLILSVNICIFSSF